MIMKLFRLFFVFIACAFAVTPALAEKPILTIYTYDSFTSDWGPGPAIEANFEEVCKCDVQFIGLDSSIGILGRIQLEGDNSKADIALGLDINLMHLAKQTGYFAELPTEISSIINKNSSLPINFEDDVFMPFDWGWFGFVYKKDLISNPPQSFSDLLDLPDDMKIVIQDPRTATPGLGLLLWIKSIYGEEASTYWQQLQPKILTVTKGWSEAYGLFLDGEADMVLSYTTSPAYHLIAEEDDNFDVAAFADGHYLQIEVAAILKNAPEPDLAIEFMKFISTPGFQQVIPTTNWMYPAFNTELPEGFNSLFQPEKSHLFDSEMVAVKQKEWINEWLQSSTN